MKTNALLIGAGVAVIALIMSNKSNAEGGGSLNFNTLIGFNDYATPEAVSRIQAIYDELSSRGFTTEQLLWMLSQICFETGIFTNVANYGLMNKNNYAGLTTVSGGYASYPNIAAFCDAYITFMTKRANPIGANSLTDFNNRLRQNGYYTENPDIYFNGLQTYYNILSRTIQ